VFSFGGCNEDCGIHFLSMIKVFLLLSEDNLQL